MIRTYKILSLLLMYPDAELQQFLSMSSTELQNEALLDQERINEISQFADHFKNMDLMAWQAEYVQLFDHSRSASLHLFEHVKGDSKDRGQAMVDLLGFYRINGLQFSGSELPDYIPVFLEFLSVQTHQKAAEILAEPVHIIDRIHLALKEKNNPYQYIFSAIVSLSAKQPDKKVTDAIIRNERPLDLDAEYEEKPAMVEDRNARINGK